MDLADNPLYLAGFGFFLAGFGLYTAFLRLTGREERLGKLEPMKQNLGFHGGNLLHIFGYTVLPIVAGAIFLWRSWERLHQ